MSKTTAGLRRGRSRRTWSVAPVPDGAWPRVHGGALPAWPPRPRRLCVTSSLATSWVGHPALPHRGATAVTLLSHVGFLASLFFLIHPTW